MELRDGYTPADLLRHTYRSQSELDVLHHNVQKNKKGTNKNFMVSNEEKKNRKREGRFIGLCWVGREGLVSLFKILSCAGTVGCHLCVIFHPWHS